jgi:hypothetical protein
MVDGFIMVEKTFEKILIMETINYSTGLSDRMHTEHRSTNVDSFNTSFRSKYRT